MKKALVVFLLGFILISFGVGTTNVSTNVESNATRAVILYNLAISQMSMGDYTDAFKNLKEAQELLPTISSVVNGFQQTYNEVKYRYTKQLLVMSKLNVATPTKAATKPLNKTDKTSKPLFIYGLLGFLAFFSLTYSLLYFVEIKKSIISTLLINSIVALASKYGYVSKTREEDELEGEDSGEIIEIEEVSQEESDKIEKEITPEDVEDENVEEILSQLLGINDEEPSRNEQILEEIEEEGQDEEVSESKETSKQESNESQEINSEDDKALSDSEEVNNEKTYSLKIDEIKDPRNNMVLSIDRLKEELHQIVSALREVELKNQDDLDNALKIMYVYATASKSVDASKQQNNKQEEEKNDK